MLPRVFRRVVAGYAAIIKPIAFLLALLAVSAALSLAIAWPLWFLATRYRLLFTACTLALVLGALIALQVATFRRRARHPETAPRLKRRMRPAVFFLFALLWLLVLAAGIYAAALSFVRGRIAFGAPLLAVLLVLLGLAAWTAGQRSGKKQG